MVHYSTHQPVTDVWTNCRERHGQVRMLPLLVSSRLSAADFPHSARKRPLQYSSRQIQRLPHLNLALSSPSPPLPIPSRSTAHSPSLFSPPPGVCWDAPRAQHLTVPASRPRGWGGANQSLLWRPPSSLRSPQISLTAGSCRAKPPPAPSYPLSTH